MWMFEDVDRSKYMARINVNDLKEDQVWVAILQQDERLSVVQAAGGIPSQTLPCAVLC